MPEATIIILDNSDFAINGDYEPTRWLSQIDAAGLLISTKMEQHQDNAMGITLSGGKQVEVICSPATDLTKVSSFLYGIKLSGFQKISNALQTSALALKHRANSNLGQRIICFVASTISESIEQLKIIAKKLKKNGVALDLVAIGDLSEQQRNKLQIMHDNANNDNNCSLLFVEEGGNLSDALFTSKIIGAEPVAPIINEENDPQLMMALQLSLQQQQQRLSTGVNNPPQQMQSEQEELQQRALQLAMQDDKKGQKKEEKDENDQ